MNARISPVRFMVVWFIAGMIVVPLALALSLTAIVAFQTAMSELTDTSAWDYWDDFTFLFVGAALLITGFCIGTLQKAILRRHLAIEIGRLSLYTALGAVLAGIVATNLNGILYRFLGLGFCCYEYDIRTSLDVALPLAGFAATLSAVQTLTLRLYFYGCWRWIAAHFGGAACACLIVMAGRIAFPTPYDGGLVQWVFASLITSLCTGLVMLRLVREARRSVKVKPATPAVAAI